MHRINQISLHFAIFRIWISLHDLHKMSNGKNVHWLSRARTVFVHYIQCRTHFILGARTVCYLFGDPFLMLKIVYGLGGRQKFIGYMRFYLYAFVCSCVSEWVCDVCAHTWQVIRNEEISTSFRKASAFTVSSTKFYNTPFVPAIGQIIQWNVNYLGNPVLVYKEQNKMI